MLEPPISMDALAELAERLLVQPYPGAPTSVQLHPGRLPPDRSVSFPLPEGARVVGSAVYRRDGAMTRAEAVVDVSAPQATAMRAYEDQLRREGWGVFGIHGGGFSPSDSGMARSFRRADRGPALLVHVTDRGRQTAGLRLQLDWDMPRHRPRYPHDWMELMPSLLAPLDVRMEGGGGGGGESYWSSTATAHTDMPASELEAHFAEQLAGAGWTRVAGDATDPVAWSTWRLPGSGPRVGLLLVTAFERNERSLLVHLQGPARRHDRSQGWLRSRRPWWRRISLRI